MPVDDGFYYIEKDSKPIFIKEDTTRGNTERKSVTGASSIEEDISFTKEELNFIKKHTSSSRKGDKGE